MVPKDGGAVNRNEEGTKKAVFMGSACQNTKKDIWN